MSGNVLFGDWGRGARGSDPDVEYAPTPVGVPCWKCHEAIRPGDVGEFMPCIQRDGTHTLPPVHRECLMLSVIGHVFGVCNCTDYAGTTTTREAALELARRADTIPYEVAAEMDWKNAKAHPGNNPSMTDPEHPEFGTGYA